MITLNTRITISEGSNGTGYLLTIPPQQTEMWIILIASLEQNRIDRFEIQDGDMAITMTLNDDAPNAKKGYVEVKRIGKQINVELSLIYIGEILEQLLDKYWHDEYFYVSMRYSTKDNDVVRLTMSDQEDDSIQETLHHIYAAFLLNIKGVSYQNIEEIEASVIDLDYYSDPDEFICRNEGDWDRFVAEFLKDNFELGATYFRGNELDGQAAVKDYWAVVDVETMQEWALSLARLSDHGLVRLMAKDLSRRYVLSINLDRSNFVGTIRMLRRKA